MMGFFPKITCHPSTITARKMRLLGLCGASLLLLVSVTDTAQADTIRNAEQVVEMWDPQNIKFEDGTLTIVTHERRVTDTIYLAIIKAGLCLAPLTGKPMDEVSEIRILNKHEAQGYVYEKGLEDCETFNNRPAADEKTDIDILGATHLF